MVDLDERWLKQEIKSFTKAQKIAFALLLCERMAPALEKVAEQVEFDDSIYRESLKVAWNYLEEAPRVSNYGDLAEKCLEHAPDTEAFSCPLISAVLSAALSIAAMVSLLADDDVNHVVEIASLARDTAALYAQSITAIAPRSLDYDEVTRHPLVQRELRQQVDDVEFLRALPDFGSQRLITLLKARIETTPALKS